MAQGMAQYKLLTGNKKIKCILNSYIIVSIKSCFRRIRIRFHSSQSFFIPSPPCRKAPKKKLHGDIWALCWYFLHSLPLVYLHGGSSTTHPMNASRPEKPRPLSRSEFCNRQIDDLSNFHGVWCVRPCDQCVLHSVWRGQLCDVVPFLFRFF